MNEQLLRERFRETWDELAVGPAPVAAVVGAPRRRAGLVVGLVAAGVAAVLGVVLLVPGGPRDAAPAVEPPALVWWADDALHVGAAVVAAPGLETLVVVGEAGTVVYADEDGAVVQVGPDGGSMVIGDASPGAPIAGSASSPWVAWVDPGHQGPMLYVRDVGTGETVTSLGLSFRGPRWGHLDAGSYPIAIDGPEVYAAVQDGDIVVSSQNENGALVVGGNNDFLVDHAGGLGMVFHPRSDTLTLGQDVAVAGSEDATLSDDGRFYLPGGGRWRPRRTDDGAATRLDLDAVLSTIPGGTVVRAAFSGGDRVTYVVGSEQATPDTSLVGVSPTSYGRFDLVTCALDTGRCELTVPSASRTRMSFGSSVVLPR